MSNCIHKATFIRKSLSAGGLLPVTFLIIFSFFTSLNASAQYTKYETKVVTDSGVVKGILQMVNEEGLAIKDKDGRYIIVKAKNILKVKVHKKGLTLGSSVAGGAGVGLSVGAAIFFSDASTDMNFGQKAGATAILTGVGVAGGFAGGAVAELINLRVVLLIDGNEKRYKENFKKLQRYTREKYMGPQTASIIP